MHAVKIPFEIIFSLWNQDRRGWRARAEKVIPLKNHRLKATISHPSSSQLNCKKENEEFLSWIFFYLIIKMNEKEGKLFVDHEEVFFWGFFWYIGPPGSTPPSLRAAWTRWVNKHTNTYWKLFSVAPWNQHKRSLVISLLLVFFYYFCKLLRWSFVYNNISWMWINARTFVKPQKNPKHPEKILFKCRISEKKISRDC